jgi:hypothetical protein
LFTVKTTSRIANCKVRDYLTATVQQMWLEFICEPIIVQSLHINTTNRDQWREILPQPKCIVFVLNKLHNCVNRHKLFTRKHRQLISPWEREIPLSRNNDPELWGQQAAITSTLTCRGQLFLQVNNRSSHPPPPQVNNLYYTSKKVQGKSGRSRKLRAGRRTVIQVAPQLCSRAWVDPVPDPLLLRNSGKNENPTRTSGSVARNSWPLDCRGGHRKQ